jgi:hypothetical protein
MGGVLQQHADSAIPGTIGGEDRVRRHDIRSTVAVEIGNGHRDRVVADRISRGRQEVSRVCSILQVHADEARVRWWTGDVGVHGDNVRQAVPVEVRHGDRSV